MSNERPWADENRRRHRAMVEGVPVEHRVEDGTIRGHVVRLVNPDDQHNDWLAIPRFTVIENGRNRRAEVLPDLCVGQITPAFGHQRPQ